MNACAHIAVLKGAGSRHHRDCLLRAVRDMPLPAALAALGLPSDQQEIVIQAGIGTLVIRDGFSSFTAAPSLGQMASSIAVAAIDALGQALSGEPVAATVATRESRLVICRACPLWDSAGERCRSCGCNGTAKAMLAASRCPDGRWDVQGAG